MGLRFTALDLGGAFLVEPRVNSDHRGFFLESYSEKAFEAQGLNIRFVQDNHSLSRQAGVLRGLHFQIPPSAQTKLVRVTRGSIYDVIVDLRHASPTYGRWLGFELNASNYRMLLVPKGFAHGFCTLEPDTEVQYKVDCLYAPEHDTGLRWNDPTLAVRWPIANPVLSAKDENLPLFRDFASPF
jgi:dTDP-4-dehydrorhamnose 3,5-epimerase